MTWHPIASAPKDRKIALRGWYEPSDYAAKNGAKSCHLYGEGSWIYGDTWSGIISKPTHWQPLPEDKETIK